jgi:hypothetical protein
LEGGPRLSQWLRIINAAVIRMTLKKRIEASARTMRNPDMIFPLSRWRALLRVFISAFVVARRRALLLAKRLSIHVDGHKDSEYRKFLHNSFMD